MTISNIWVFAQANDGAVTTGTLELLTKARSSVGNVSAVIGGDASAVAGTLGEFGASRVYATGDLGGALPGAAIASALVAVIEGGDRPDLIMFPQNYEGRDVMARLSVKLDRTVITNNTDLSVDGDSVTVITPVFGGNTLVATTFSGEGPSSPRSAPSRSAAESAGGGAAEVMAAPVPDLGSTGGATVTAVHVEESTGPKLDEAEVVVSEAAASARPTSSPWSTTSPRCSRERLALREPSSTPAGCPTRCRSARPARS